MDGFLDDVLDTHKLLDKCKKEILYYVYQEWNATNILCIDQVSNWLWMFFYGSASKSLIKKVETVQAQSLRICCGALRSSPISALQVDAQKYKLIEINNELLD